MRKNVRTLVLILAGAALLAAPAAAQKQVLRLLFDGPVTESPLPDAELAAMFGAPVPDTLHGLVKKINAAAADADIRGAAMILEDVQLNFAQLEEISRALQNFRSKGKKIYCYMDQAQNASYALSANADHITLAEYSDVWITGLHAELGYYKGLLDKIGVEADMTHCGAYKSALEPYTRTSPSPEAAENINWLLDGIYARWIRMMADGRGISPNKMKEIVDTAPISSSRALELRLIDAVGSFEDFQQLIHKEFGKDVEVVKKYPREDALDVDLDPSNPFTFFTEMNKIVEELFGGGEDEQTGPGIGLVYVDGPIVVGRSESGGLFGGGATAASTTIRAALDAAREDENVKAVVMRVSSPGGSALASDIIWKAATRLAKEKPLIVSMGGVAGSGGYYVSIPGDTIFAEETTITASIGVVGGKLVWQDLMEDKLGITTTEFERGARAGLFSMNRTWSEKEREWLQSWMNEVYEQFKGRIRDSRGDRLKTDLEEIAGGRVFTGKQALEHGLVDRIGGLGDAIEFAREKAGVSKKDSPVYVFPKAKGFAEVMAQLFGQETEDEWDVSTSVRLGGDPLVTALSPLLQRLAPEQLRAAAEALTNLLILDREHVSCFMPFNLNVR